MGVSSLAFVLTGHHSIGQTAISIFLGVFIHVYNTNLPQFMMCIDTILSLILGLCIALDRNIPISSLPQNPLFSTWLWAFSFQFFSFSLLLKQHTNLGYYRSLFFSLNYLILVDYSILNGKDISMDHHPKSEDVKNGFWSDQDIIKMLHYTFTIKAFLLCLIFNGISFFSMKYGWLTKK